MENIVGSIITGGLALIGVIISNLTAHRKTSHEMEISQAVTNEKIETLTEEVKKHNAFAEKIPLLEERIKVVNHRLSDLERSELQ